MALIYLSKLMAFEVMHPSSPKVLLLVDTSLEDQSITVEENVFPLWSDGVTVAQSRLRF